MPTVNKRHIPGASSIALRGSNRFLQEARLVGAAVLSALGLLHYGFSVIPWALRRHGMDFGTFYRATCSGALYAEDPLSPRIGSSAARDLNAPHTHLLLSPLCSLDPSSAYVVWLVVGAIVFILAVLWSRRSSPLPVFAWPLLGLSAATYAWVLTGQVTGVLVPFVLLAWTGDRKRSPLLAGTALGLLIAMKSFFALVVLWWLARREWRALAAATAAAAGSLALGTAVYGPDALRAWMDNLHAVSWPWLRLNASIWAPWARAFGETSEYTPFFVSPLLRQAATGVAILLVTAGTAAGLHRNRNIDYGWALCLLAGLLLSPLGWTYYGWLVIPILLRNDVPPWAWVVASACWILPPSLIAYLSAGSAWSSFTVGSAYTWGLLAMWCGVIRAALVDSDAAKAVPHGRRPASTTARRAGTAAYNLPP